MSDYQPARGPGYPGAPYTPAVTAPVAPRPGGRAGVVVVSIIAALALVAAGIAVFLVLRPEPSEAGEVFLEAADVTGPDPFTTQVAVQPLPSTTSSSTTTTAPVVTGTVRATVGSQPGLYGGTQDAGRCDSSQLVAFLAANPDKAAAFVSALNRDPSLRWSGGTQVQVGQIPAYVAELTPVTLAGDTRVTNYGYANGQPTPRQAVLQRGTAVLVDAYGVPRTKCGCGNPLTRPAAVATAPVYQGTAWPGWSPTTVVVVQETTVVIETFVIVNLAGPGYIDRPAGSNGDRDTPSSYTGDETTSPTAPSSTSTPTTPTTPTSEPVPTLPPADFCAQFAAIQAKWSTSVDESPAAAAELMADFDLLTAASPAEVHDDMVLIAEWLRTALGSDTLGLADIPPEVDAAEERVTTYLVDVCGLTIE